MTENIVLFETAKLAKEKGFNELCKLKYYNTYGRFETIYGSGKYHDDILGEEWVDGKQGVLLDNRPNLFPNDEFNAPTQSLLQKWLRETHQLDIEIETVWEDDRKVFKKYCPWVYYRANEEGGDEPIVGLNTYEEALEEALIQALKSI
jgi:hypothetical protein